MQLCFCCNLIIDAWNYIETFIFHYFPSCSRNWKGCFFVEMCLKICLFKNTPNSCGTIQQKLVRVETQFVPNVDFQDLSQSNVDMLCNLVLFPSTAYSKCNKRGTAQVAVAWKAQNIQERAFVFKKLWLFRQIFDHLCSLNFMVQRPKFSTVTRYYNIYCLRKPSGKKIGICFTKKMIFSKPKGLLADEAQFESFKTSENVYWELRTIWIVECRVQ